MSMLNSQTHYEPSNSHRSINLNPNPNTNTPYPQTSSYLNPTYKSINNFDQLGSTGIPINQNPNYPQTFFREKPLNFQWRDLMKIDLDNIQRTGEYAILESFIDNLVNSNATEEEIQAIPEINLVKLIKIFQLVILKLLNSQSNLESNVNILTGQVNKLFDDLQMANITLQDNKSTINKLKKQSQTDDISIKGYQWAIMKLKKQLEAAEKLNANIMKSSITSNGNFFCEYCPGKKYPSEDRLNDHLTRVHRKNLPKTEASNKENYDDKINQLKSHLEGMINSWQSGYWKRDLGGLRREEEELFNKKLSDAENNWKTQLQELKDWWRDETGHIKNTWSVQPQVIQPQPQDNSAESHLVQELKNVRETISMQNDQNKIINDLKLKHQAEIKELQDRIDKWLKNSLEPQKNIKITVQPKHDVEEKQESALKFPIVPARKKEFNSGNIESDHDDSDIEKPNDTKAYKQWSEQAKLFQEVTKIWIPEEKKLSSSQNSWVSEKKEIEPKPVERKENENVIESREMFLAQTQYIHNPEFDPLALARQFADKYEKRDREINKDPKMISLFKKEIIDKDKYNTTSKINNSLKMSINDTKNIANISQINWDDFQFETKGNWRQIINNSLSVLQDYNSKDNVLKNYYNTITKCLGFDTIQEEYNKCVEAKESKVSMTSMDSMNSKKNDSNIGKESINVTDRVNSFKKGGIWGPALDED